MRLQKSQQLTEVGAEAEFCFPSTTASLFVSLRSPGWENINPCQPQVSPQSQEAGKSSSSSSEIWTAESSGWHTLAGHFSPQLCCSGHPILAIFFQQKDELCFVCLHWRSFKNAAGKQRQELPLGAASPPGLLRLGHSQAGLSWDPPSSEREGTFTSCHLPVSAQPPQTADGTGKGLGDR